MQTKRSDVRRLMAGPRWSKLADRVGRDDVNTIDNKLIEVLTRTLRNSTSTEHVGISAAMGDGAGKEWSNRQGSHAERPHERMRCRGEDR